MDKFMARKRWCCWYHFLAMLMCLHIFSSLGTSLGLSMFQLSDVGSGINFTTAGIAWVSTTDGPNLNDGAADGNAMNDGQAQPLEEATSAQVETPFATIDSMLKWAIDHSDPEKLKGAAQEVHSMTSQQIEKQQLELKELMERLRMKSDADLMKISLADLQNVSSPAADRQRALQGLLLLVEPIDNANDLNKLGGLVVVIGELNREEEDLRTTAAWVLGKASQNNPVVQDQLLRLGALPKLMKMVASTDNEEAVKALYAVSALIRNFPSGQEAFYMNDGAALLQVVLSSENGDARLQKKALFLIADLAEQQTEAQGQAHSFGMDDELLKSVVRMIGAEELDTQEKALMALRSLIGLNGGICERLRNLCQAEAVLERLRLHYEELILDPEQADYVKDLELLREEVSDILKTDNEMAEEL